MAQVSGDENLRPRSRDLLQALMAPTHRRPDRTRPLLALLISGDVVPQESLTVEQNAVIRAIFSVVHTRKVFDAIETGQLTEIVNYFLKKAGEPLRLKPRKTGAVLTSLGFCNRTRTNTGWVVRMTRGDAEKIHELADRYGIFNMSDRLLMVGREDCPLCRSIMEKNSKLTPAGPVSSSESINITEALRGR